MAQGETSTTSDHKLTLAFTPHTVIHIRLQSLAKCLVVHLTSTTHETSSAASTALGSFVYAIPNRLDASNPLSTPLVTVPASIEFATRAAKILAKRTAKPVYVSSSIDLSWGPGGAGAPEVSEEVEALRKVVDLVTGKVSTMNGANGTGMH